jgi:single-strand DNA-binding protein
MSINSITLTGRAGRDPEARYFESGRNVTEVSIAVDKFKKEDKPDWFDVKFWGKQGEVAANYLRKGSLFGVTGRLELETWTDKDGNKRSKAVIVGERLQLLGSKRDEEAPGGAAPAAQGSDEEVPF